MALVPPHAAIAEKQGQCRDNRSVDRDPGRRNAHRSGTRATTCGSPSRTFGAQLAQNSAEPNPPSRRADRTTGARSQKAQRGQSGRPPGYGETMTWDTNLCSHRRGSACKGPRMPRDEGPFKRTNRTDPNRTQRFDGPSPKKLRPGRCGQCV